jgi:voltage-gated potassium channel
MVKKESIAIPLVVLAILYLLSVLFFHYVEGWSYLDAAYFTTSTISTVGYGDLVPQSDYGKMGSIALIFTGVGLAFYVFTRLGFLRQKKVDPAVKKRLEMLRSFTMASTGMNRRDLQKLKKKIMKRDKN